MQRPKKITILDKQTISDLVKELLKHKKLTITNLCVLELSKNEVSNYYNVATGETKKTPEYRVNIKKTRYLKDEIRRQSKKGI